MYELLHWFNEDFSVEHIESETGISSERIRYFFSRVLDCLTEFSRHNMDVATKCGGMEEVNIPEDPASSRVKELFLKALRKYLKKTPENFIEITYPEYVEEKRTYEMKTRRIRSHQVLVVFNTGEEERALLHLMISQDTDIGTCLFSLNHLWRQCLEDAPDKMPDEERTLLGDVDGEISDRVLSVTEKDSDSVEFRLKEGTKCTLIQNPDDRLLSLTPEHLRAFRDAFEEVNFQDIKPKEANLVNTQSDRSAVRGPKDDSGLAKEIKRRTLDKKKTHVENRANELILDFLQSPQFEYKSSSDYNFDEVGENMLFFRGYEFRKNWNHKSNREFANFLLDIVIGRDSPATVDATYS